MLGSIQKYRPSKKPEPYNHEQRLLLQGINNQGTKKSKSVVRHARNPAGAYSTYQTNKEQLAKALSFGLGGDSFMETIQSASPGLKGDDTRRTANNRESRNKIADDFGSRDLVSAYDKKDVGAVRHSMNLPKIPITTRHNDNKDFSVTLTTEGFNGGVSKGADIYSTRDQITSGRGEPNKATQDKHNNSIFSEALSMSAMGKQIHQNLREPTERGNSPKKRMHFGGLDKYTGIHEKPKALGLQTQRNAQMSPQMSMSKRAESIGNRSSLNQTRQLDKAMRSVTAGGPGIETIELDSNRTRTTLLGDSYLPALRNFATTKRAPVKSSAQAVAEFSKNQQLDADTIVPKLISREVINKKRTASLFDRQRNILVHAHMQQPVKSKEVKSMQKTRFKDWVVREVDGKIKQSEKTAEAKHQASLTKKESEKVEKGPDDSDSSDDRYDPLAESDGSEDEDNSPHRLTSEEIQKVIRQEMQEKGQRFTQKGFWKGMVSCSDPDPPLDDEGNPIEMPEKKPANSFAMIKKMIKLKQRQNEVPESDKQRFFVPRIQPQFVENGKDKYYFDMKNNLEHYQMMTNDMTEEEFAVFEEREKVRNDAAHYTKKLMQGLLKQREEEEKEMQRQRKEDSRRKIDIETMGPYESIKIQLQNENLFHDDDDLLESEIIMDTCERHETKAASEAHVTKQKTLRMNEFARDVVNGIIWDEIKQQKVSPSVLFAMATQQKMGLKILKKFNREKDLKRLNAEIDGKQSETNNSTLSNNLATESDIAAFKDLFISSMTKNEFFEVAKGVQNTKDIAQSKVTHAMSYKKFFEKCQQAECLALPIFSKVQNQVLSIVGQYISAGSAHAMAETFKRVIIPKADGTTTHQKATVSEDRVPYIPIREINLDDNGLKDASFAAILGALATQPSVKRISYVNNEIGSKSIEELSKLLASDTEGDLSDLRICHIKSTKRDLNLLLNALSKSTSRLTRLRLAHIDIDEFVLMQSLQKMVFSVPHLQELNLTQINMHGRQFADLMETISENCQQISYLNLSYNTLPQKQEWHTQFLTHLVNMINSSSKLIDINISGMNFREHVKTIQWPLAKSKTLQAIHMSDNNIPKAIETNMLMVFGIKSNEDGDGMGLTSRIDPRQLKRSNLTSFQMKMQFKSEEQKAAEKSFRGVEAINEYSVPKETGMITTLDDATAKIANAVELRDMKDERNYFNSCQNRGIGRASTSVQPLVITRKLGHPELIFNENDSKNTHFKVHASSKWTRMQGHECWVCDQWKYCVIFFSRKNWMQHYNEITDQEKIDQLNQTYDMHQDDLILVQNQSYPLLMGSITRNTVISMTEISMFNLFLDDKNIKKSLGGQGERAMRAVLSVSQGMKNTFGSKLSSLTEQDWLTRLKDNLPYPQKDMLIANLPETDLSNKINQGIPLTKEESKKRKAESTSDVFCFAGFIEPGKHQIIVKDQTNGKFYAREIVVDVRNREIVTCNQVEQDKSNEAIRRFETEDEVTGKTIQRIDLDNSVFMNFKRYTKQDVANCFEADMRSSTFESVVEDEKDLEECAMILRDNYAAYCQCFHELAAQFNHFPLISLADLGQAIYTIGFMGEAKAELVAQKVTQKVKELEALNSDQPLPADAERLLNRVKFAEILLMVLQVDEEITQKLPEGQQLQDFQFHTSLLPLFTRFIQPFLTDKTVESLPNSLNAFRDRYVWVERVNTILELNLEGIMDVFSKFSEDIGFTKLSAEKLLKGMGCLLSQRVVSMQFDLAQMTVIDESVNSAEYTDMEFVEFLDFLVRIAFQIGLGDAEKSISDKVADFISEMFALTNITFVQPPSHRPLQAMASDDDIQAFHKYITKKF